MNRFHPTWARACAFIGSVALIGSVAGAGASYPGYAYRDGPPPAHTGGFGEPTCQACHASKALNAGPGSVTLRGLPPTYTPGETYQLEILLSHEGLRAGGFELAVRFDEGPDTGKQAGLLIVPDTTMAVTEQEHVLYAHQRDAGSTPQQPDSMRWSLQWRAPDRAGSIVMHLAANAANDDNSEFDDLIYATSARSRAAPSR